MNIKGANNVCRTQVLSHKGTQKNGFSATKKTSRLEIQARVKHRMALLAVQ
jgi:hypothetical protein